MSDPRRPQGPDPYQQPGWPAPTEPLGDRNPPYPDPAYAGQFSYPSYTPPPGPNDTQELPPYWTQTQYQSPQEPPAPPPPEPPGTPRWLWLLAGAAVLLVVGLVVALVIANGASKQDNVLAPLTTTPGVPEPTARTTTAPTTTPRTTTRTPTPSPTTGAPGIPPTSPTETTATGESQTVVYSVTGEGRAINITYVDTGGMMQMEFNVALPWSREVTLESASQTASVSVVTVGREVTCTVTVDGAQLHQKTGNGLTICSPLG